MNPPLSGIYRHYKRGTQYRVHLVALREEDLVPCVVYESLDPGAEHRFWIRPVEDFMATVTDETGKGVPRFSPVED